MHIEKKRKWITGYTNYSELGQPYNPVPWPLRKHLALLRFDRAT